MNNNVNADITSSIIGLDVAKNIFRLYSIGPDRKAIKRKLKRAGLLAFFANYPVSLVWDGSLWRFASLGQGTGQTGA